MILSEHIVTYLHLSSAYVYGSHRLATSYTTILATSPLTLYNDKVCLYICIVNLEDSWNKMVLHTV